MKKYIIFLFALLFAISCGQKADFVGEWFSDDSDEPDLLITRGDDGKYAVRMSIYRLTTLEDGVGELSGDGLAFTATDASGNPIGALITLEGDSAVVTFTDSSWPLLENGSAFKYHRLTLPEDPEVLKRVQEIYAAVAAHPERSREHTARYCSKEWKALEDSIMVIDEMFPGEIGFFDSDYWVQGQDYANLSISDLRLERQKGDTSVVTLCLHNMGTITILKLTLVLESGKWMVDNIESLGEHGRNWKLDMMDYVERFN